MLDFGAIHDLYVGPEGIARIMELAPSTVLRSFGLGCACQALGGLCVACRSTRSGRAAHGPAQTRAA